ncbi:MAG: ATP-binding cassette domain-containing protein [Thermoleophilia bacterium]|jgi:Fe-S cluster assembly ATP-binding protein
MLKVRNINLKKGDRQIISDVSFEVDDGEVFGILGANGAGKSSLAYALMGCPEYQPDHGTITFDGLDITDKSMDERARLGITLAWQEPARFEGLGVADFVMLGSGGHDRNADSYLELMRLPPEEYRQRKVDRTLSGGERKKIELASVLAMRPRLAILDEPDSGIDMISQDAIISMIDTIRGYGGSIILITHEEEVIRTADRAALMCSGLAFKVGEPREVVDYYRHICRPCPSKDYPSEEDIAASGKGNVSPGSGLGKDAG